VTARSCNHEKSVVILNLLSLLFKMSIFSFIKFYFQLKRGDLLEQQEGKVFSLQLLFDEK
jgi:hypothetical protein